MKDGTSASETCGYPHVHTNAVCPLGPKDKKGYPVPVDEVPKSYWKKFGIVSRSQARRVASQLGESYEYGEPDEPTRPE